LKSSIKSLGSTAASFSRKWFVREPVWVFSATSSFSVFNTVLKWAMNFFVKTVALTEVFIDSTTGDEQVESPQNKHTFDFTGAVLTESGVVDWVNVVESVAVENQVSLSGTSSWQVLNFPRDARVVSGQFFVVDHATVVSVGELFTDVIDTVEWFSVTSSVVVFEVAPASVLVDSVKVVAGKNVGDGSIDWGS